jgi:hypothetical protein
MKQLLLNILALFLLLEEWLWDALTALGRILIAKLHLQAVEDWLRQTRPPVAVAAMLAPVLIVTPLNFFAVWLLLQGHALAFLQLEAVAKLLGTLLVARVFNLTKPQLLTYKAINCLYVTISGWLAWAHRIITTAAVYRWAQQLKAAAKARWRSWRA